jgi:hypothetical protein
MSLKGLDMPQFTQELKDWRQGELCQAIASDTRDTQLGLQDTGESLQREWEDMGDIMKENDPSEEEISEGEDENQAVDYHVGPRRIEA